jgi:rhamnogalacturonan endolyase
MKNQSVHYFKALFFVSIVLIINTLTAFDTFSPSVTLKEDAHTYTIDNGLVIATMAKASGDLVSLRYKGMELLATFLTPEGEPDLQKDPPGANPNGLNKGMTDHQYGFWSHDAMGPRGTAPTICTVTIDPKTNGGERAEVSIKGISDGRKMGTGPGASQDGQFAADIEIRYSIGRGESGVYTYCIFEHKPSYPYTQLGEARFCAKLAPFFDWMSVDAARDFLYPTDLHVGDKYIYTAVQSVNPALGWSSTSKKVGLFIINPSMEYMSGGPTKVEFMGHRDTNPVAAACVLNYWRSSHYGGAEVNVNAGENWNKVVGPFFIYVNSGADAKSIYEDAKALAPIEAKKWPYSWIKEANYPQASQRSKVSGRLLLKDLIVSGPFKNLKVGLTAPAYISPRQASSSGVQPPEVITDWQRDAKFYQFWTNGKPDGTFNLTNVRAGHYSLHAFADGVPGELVVADIIVKEGKPLNLGEINWIPVRYGRLLWDIGIPNRNASEFFMADKHDDPEISYEYGKLFPQDVSYTIGKSNFRKDWFFQHVPHNENPAAKSSPYSGANSPGRATPYNVIFTMSSVPNGKATLRLAICGTGANTIIVTVNGKPAGNLEHLFGDGTITRHGSQGIWYERTISFDAGLMVAGSNTLTLTVPAGPVNNGIMYDYISLELAE